MPAHCHVSFRPCPDDSVPIIISAGPRVIPGLYPAERAKTHLLINIILYVEGVGTSTYAFQINGNVSGGLNASRDVTSSVCLGEDDIVI